MKKTEVLLECLRLAYRDNSTPEEIVRGALVFARFVDSSAWERLTLADQPPQPAPVMVGPMTAESVNNGAKPKSSKG